MTGDGERHDEGAPASSWDDALARLLGREEPTAESIAAGGGFWVRPNQAPPLVALLPLPEVPGPVTGRRVRRRSGEGAIWLVDLRVWSEPRDGVVRVVHEADWYRLRVARLQPPLLPICYDVDVSTVCVEQHVNPTVPPRDEGEDPNAWLRRLHHDPLQPPPIVPVRARNAGHLLGRRAIVTTPDDVLTDLRVVSEPTDDGHGIVVNTLDEADWHVHAAVNPGVDMWRSFRSTPIDQVWIET